MFTKLSAVMWSKFVDGEKPPADVVGDHGEFGAVVGLEDMSRESRASYRMAGLEGGDAKPRGVEPAPFDNKASDEMCGCGDKPQTSGCKDCGLPRSLSDEMSEWCTAGGGAKLF
mmetsp:Transcript_78048/g.196179  ORF Transcript_78048/g.196179 Transcript_78048/m.196179 type:complete len:114 (-) Transcript_78048:14-355(-)